jgi:hypothetical protein
MWPHLPFTLQDPKASKNFVIFVKSFVSLVLNFLN